MSPASQLRFAAQGACRCVQPRAPQTRIVVTGGPGAGKTAVLELASRTFCEHVGIVPESAGVVFGGGFPRLESETGRQAAQRAIFHIQRQLEAIADSDGQFSIVLCDRGTADGAAYWPGPMDTYWSGVGTTREHELSRYSVVVHLRTPSIHHGYNHDNNLRTETADEAAAIDARIDEAWRDHPNRIVISSEVDFPTKAARAIEAISQSILISREEEV